MFPVEPCRLPSQTSYCKLQALPLKIYDSQFLICHSVGILPRSACPVAVVPFMNQRIKAPVWVFCQIRSVFLSPSKSPEFVTRYLLDALPISFRLLLSLLFTVERCNLPFRTSYCKLQALPLKFYASQFLICHSVGM